jgi:4-amino-4-deoxy-L-arabinose transferase-like glycosyltransferase
LHTLAWPLAASLYDGDVAVHYDMLESWAWGKEPQFGYYKHPPLFAWLAGLWFQVMPRENFFFYLLASLNSGIGLLAVWLFARRFLDRSAWLAAVALVMLAPFHGVLALKFNANTILLSLFPWIAYAFLRSLETKSAFRGAVFGVLAGLGILSKYYTIVLLLCCLVAALLHPDRRAYFRSAAPYAAVLAGAATIVPHVLWMLDSDFLTLRYAVHQSGISQSFGQTVVQALSTLLRGTAFQALPLAVLLLMLGHQAMPTIAKGFGSLFRRDRLWLGALLLGPFGLTVLLGLLANLKVTPNYVIPALSLLPIAALLAAAPLDQSQRRLAIGIATALLVAVVVAGAGARLAGLKPAGAQSKEPARALAIAATRAWREATGRPLKLSAGSRSYALALPFYSPDAPSDFSHFSVVESPWATSDIIARHGLLVVCVRADLECLKKAAPYVPGDARRFELALPWPAQGVAKDAVERFELFVVPPR